MFVNLLIECFPLIPDKVGEKGSIKIFLQDWKLNTKTKATRE